MRLKRDRLRAVVTCLCGRTYPFSCPAYYEEELRLFAKICPRCGVILSVRCQDGQRAPFATWFEGRVRDNLWVREGPGLKWLRWQTGRRNQ